jgi:hypothetical protein
MDESRYCWKCKTTYDPQVAVCLKCGVNLITGEELAVESKEEEPLTFPERVFRWIADCFPGLLRPKMWLPALLMACLALAVMWLCLFVFSMGAVLSAFPIGAMALIIYAQAVVWLITGQFWLLHTALTEFQGRHWSIFVLLVLGPLVVGILLLSQIHVE